MNLIEKAIARLEESPPAGAPGKELQDRLKGIYPLNLGPTAEADRISRGGSRGRADPGRAAPIARPSAQPVEAPRDIPLAKLQEQGFLTPDGRASALGREFRSIKSKILEKAFGSDAQRVANGRRVVVTSALPDEGKTFCAINLAISIAATGDHKVLLIDADVVKPSISASLGIESDQGLIDVLTGKEPDVLRIVLQTSIPGLAVITAGKTMPHAGEHLAGSEMASLLDFYGVQFPNALIIIDTPPLLAVTETRSLIQRVGQVVLVVAAGATTQASLDAALLQITGAPEVSMILNKVPEAKSQFATYYGY